MSTVSTLTVALSTLNQHGFRMIECNKSHAEFYHIYYMASGVKRVMLVPRKCDDLEKLQKEVAILLNRSIESQDRMGTEDGKA